MEKDFFWKRALRLVFDLLFPISCLGCGKSDVWICRKCLQSIPGFPRSELEKIRIKGIDEIIVAAGYDNQLVQKAVHLLKYKSVADLAKPLAEVILNNTAVSKLENDNLIIPVPLHRRRQRERGFNQSDLIAKALADRLDWEMRDDVLIRKKHTTPQMKLDREDRLQNLKDAFELRKPLPNKNIVLVDDVLTTGSTLRECARVLKKYGAKIITAVCVAHGQ